MTAPVKSNTKSVKSWLNFNSANFLIGGVGLGLTWAFFVPHCALEYQVSQVTPLLNKDAKDPEISVQYHGQSVDDPYLVELRLANVGNRAIKESDYTDAFVGGRTRGLEIRFQNPSVSVISASVGSMTPPNRRTFGVLLGKGFNEQPGNLKVLLPALALNPGDSYTIKLLVDQKPDDIELSGHILDCQLKHSDRRSWSFQWPKTWDPLLAGFLGLCIGGVIYKLLSWYRQTQLLISWVWRWIKIICWMEEHKPDTEQTTNYLVNNDNFRRLCKELGVRNNDQKELLRRELTKRVGKFNMEPPSASAEKLIEATTSMDDSNITTVDTQSVEMTCSKAPEEKLLIPQSNIITAPVDTKEI